jgi:hypothetical protein
MLRPANVKVTPHSDSQSVEIKTAGDSGTATKTPLKDGSLAWKGERQAAKLDRLMSEYDKDQSGAFSNAEVKAIIKDLDATQTNEKRLVKLVMVSLFAIIFLTFALFGITFFGSRVANEATKESHVSEDSAELVSLSGETIRVDRVEAFSTLLDLTKLSNEVLLDLESVTFLFDDSSNLLSSNDQIAPAPEWIEATFKVDAALRPVGRAHQLRVLTPQGYILTLDSNTSKATFQMEGLVHSVRLPDPDDLEILTEEGGLENQDDRRRRLAAARDVHSESLILLSREQFEARHGPHACGAIAPSHRSSSNHRRLMKESESKRTKGYAKYSRSPPGGYKSASYCSSKKTCKECTGNCDNDYDCQGNLACYIEVTKGKKKIIKNVSD